MWQCNMFWKCGLVQMWGGLSWVENVTRRPWHCVAARPPASPLPSSPSPQAGSYTSSPHPLCLMTASWVCLPPGSPPQEKLPYTTKPNDFLHFNHRSSCLGQTRVSSKVKIDWACISGQWNTSLDWCADAGRENVSANAPTDRRIAKPDLPHSIAWGTQVQIWKYIKINLGPKLQVDITRVKSNLIVLKTPFCCTLICLAVLFAFSGSVAWVVGSNLHI